ncbi:hypothetical protein V4C85_21330 [Ralstonia solanacearum]|uniref:hypothetical protein n=1 Tax=Ralstonia solanacearum TaxID=305 RepID=UPI0007C93DCC|nr:hypothetical protein [Ralstonia solanacearum]OAI65792.1 hypothetical protein RSP597_19960 [Ralstonia solanacearum]
MTKKTLVALCCLASMLLGCTDKTADMPTRYEMQGAFKVWAPVGASSDSVEVQVLRSTEELRSVLQAASTNPMNGGAIEMPNIDFAKSFVMLVKHPLLGTAYDDELTGWRASEQVLRMRFRASGVEIPTAVTVPPNVWVAGAYVIDRQGYTKVEVDLNGVVDAFDLQ